MKSIVNSVLILLFILTFIQKVDAESSQTWYFTDNNFDGTPANDGLSHFADKLMSKTAPKASDAYIGIYQGGIKSTWWYADNAALTNVSFGENSWTVGVYLGSGSGGYTLTITICKVSGSSITDLASGTTYPFP